MKLPLWVMAPEHEQVISSPPGLMTRMACTQIKGSISRIAWGISHANANHQQANSGRWRHTTCLAAQPDALASVQ